MSKEVKILALQRQLTKAMPKIIIANDAQYGGALHEGPRRYQRASPLASLGAVVMGEALRRQRVRNVGADGMPANNAANRQAVSAQGWLEMGKPLYQRIQTAQDGTINTVCDTLAAYALYVIKSILNLGANFELVHNPHPTDHHFVVVDRADGSEINDCTTWGADCFVIDLWDAKREGLDNAGVYADPSDHTYSGEDYEVVSEHSYEN